MNNYVIISRHQGAVEWLKQRGIEGDVIAHATEADVRGKHVIGNVPMYLASLAAKVSVIEIPNLPADLRGVDLTPTQMKDADAHL